MIETIDKAAVVAVLGSDRVDRLESIRSGVIESAIRHVVNYPAAQQPFRAAIRALQLVGSAPDHDLINALRQAEGLKLLPAPQKIQPVVKSLEVATPPQPPTGKPARSKSKDKDTNE